PAQAAREDLRGVHEMRQGIMRNMSRKKRLLVIAPLAILGMALFVFIGGEIVLRLWNWLFPDLFAWREITFCLALGLLVLCRIMVGRSGSRRTYGPRFKQRMVERWANMTPEERERFRQNMRDSCGGFRAPREGEGPSGEVPGSV